MHLSRGTPGNRLQQSQRVWVRQSKFSNCVPRLAREFNSFALLHFKPFMKA